MSWFTCDGEGRCPNGPCHFYSTKNDPFECPCPDFASSPSWKLAPKVLEADTIDVGYLSDVFEELGIEVDRDTLAALAEELNLTILWSRSISQASGKPGPPRGCGSALST